MKEILILSGKGGTGKTSLTSALADLIPLDGEISRVVFADVDVDAANLELVLSPQRLSSHQFWGGSLAEIDQQTCTGCGICQRVCRFDAVRLEDSSFLVDPIACEGCAACYYQCPEDAIAMHDQQVGEWYHSRTRNGELFHANLRPSQENSGKLVARVKEQARERAEELEADLLLVDGPPGIGCPVISAVSGADLAVIVTEPTSAGIHDLKRVLETTEHFAVAAVVVINKADIYPEAAEEIAGYCESRGIRLLGEIPFDQTIPRAMVSGLSVTAYRPDAPASRAVRYIWGKIKGYLEEATPSRGEHLISTVE